ncbi:hypothetical protein N657DRAFT_644220 [Parathielavia appendiculata]|uniref:DUF7136 domain-containing protein n=1 Tax=Parathielavia appendiculata TaxID=2587402 RepID=A0AAN6U2N7_9PEZI|nr:hypothetical protein N657DRAFT_644220 [Parathielavia appendiculata]
MRLISRTASSLVVLLVCLGVIADAAGVLEINVVFPRNETYAPNPWFPVVFAFRNAHLAQYLRPRIVWSIQNASDALGTVLGGRVHELSWVNWTIHEPYFVYGFVDLEAAEGQWELFWWGDWLSCDLSGSEPAFKVNKTEPSQRSLEFTIKAGGQAVDLVAATANDDTTCVQPGVALNVTDETRWVVDKPLDPNDYGDATCAVLASSTPTPTANPCQVEINSAAASSIWASLTARRCEYRDANDNLAGLDCLKDNAAERLAVAGVACLAAAFGALGYLLL